MYLCICCDITKKDVEEDPTIANQIGSICGACVSDGGVLGFDGVDESIVDNTCDDDNINIM